MHQVDRAAEAPSRGFQIGRGFLFPAQGFEALVFQWYPQYHQQRKIQKRGLGASTGGMEAPEGGVTTLIPEPILYYCPTFSDIPVYAHIFLSEIFEAACSLAIQ